MQRPRPIQVLVDEHDVILRMISLLNTLIQKIESGDQVSPEVFLEAADFIQNFADRCHHAKEEDLLFTRMEARGMPRQGGPIGQMLLEHDQGRGYTRAMLEAAKRWKEGDESAKSEVVKNARGYASLLSDHIYKENNILYPMAERFLSTADFGELESEFERVEKEKIGHGVHEKYVQMVERLEKQFQQGAE